MISDQSEAAPDPLGPQNLDRAFKYLKHQVEDGKLKIKKPKGKIILPGDKQEPITGEQHVQPAAACPICTAIVAMHKVVGEVNFYLVKCDNCKAEVANGNTAFVSRDLRVAWIKVPAEVKAKLEGREKISITNKEMDALALKSMGVQPIITTEPKES